MRLRVRVLRYLVLAPLALGMSGAQERPIQLSRQESISVPAVRASIVTGGFQCDSESNVYLRPYSVDGSGPILKVTPRGDKVVRYWLRLTQGFEKAQVWNFAAQEGELWILAGVGRRNYVVRFDKDGNYRSKLAIQGDFIANRIAVFPAGGFALTGAVPFGRGDDQNQPHREFIGIFDDHGRLVAEIRHLKGDVEFRPPKSRPPSAKSREAFQTVVDYERTIGLSVLQTGPDGNVYLMRATPEGPIFVISPAGKLERVYRLSPPEDARLSDIKLARGQIAAVFYRKPNRKKGETSTAAIVQVLATITGEVVRTYFNQSLEIGLGLACYEPEVFTFVGADSRGQLEIVHAAGR